MKTAIWVFIIFFLSLVSVEASVTPFREVKGEEIWEGEIKIDGIVAVRQGAKLIIKPGTRVLFVPVDYDGDDIGDGELYVEGEIQCEGTASEPVTFTVYGGDVRPAKWKYLMVNHGSNAVFKHTVFEGAFSGLQIHFSNAVVKNCVFRKNVDGLRFSTANIIACANRMTENKHGVRYEERDSKGEILFNEITGNEIGIFAVTKCSGKVVFKQNNVYNNGYNIKVGDDQRERLSFVNNYFGDTSESKIRARIYDKNFEKDLPDVRIAPFLGKKVSIGDNSCELR